MNKVYSENIRIQLRSLEISDAIILYKWENDYNDLFLNESFNPISKEYIKDFIINSPNYLSHNSSITMMIEELKTHKPVGYIQLLEYNAISRRASIGIFIDRNSRRKNFAKESIRLFISYAFRRWNIRMLYAKVLDNNISSKCLFKSLGFELVASIPNWEWIDDKFVSLNYYQLCNS